MSLSKIWPTGADRAENGELTFHGITSTALLNQFGSPLYVIDTDELGERAHTFVMVAAHAFANDTTHVSYAGKAFLSKEVARIVADEGMLIDTCTLGEMRIALAAGIPGRRLVLHGNNKTDEEIELAIREHFNKIVIDEPSEAQRIADIAERLHMRARVMVRVTTGIHAGGHEFVSTAHEDQKFGIALLPADGATADLDTIFEDLPEAGSAPEPLADETAEIEREDEGLVAGADDRTPRYPYDPRALDLNDDDRSLRSAMDVIAAGPAIAALKAVRALDSRLELVGAHTHIGSNIHDADAFIQSARRMMLLRRTFYATDGYILPEIDLGGGYSVAYTDNEDSMNITAELERLAKAVHAANERLSMPTPALSFEPGRWIVAPTGVTLYTVGTVKPVKLSSAMDSAGNPILERLYVSVDGGMSDNIRPALYGSDYTAVLANRESDAPRVHARIVGKHCESGDILVSDIELPSDIHRGDIIAIPVTGAYGRTMASNYNQALIPAVAAVDHAGAHVMMRRQTIEDLLSYDVSE